MNGKKNSGVVKFFHAIRRFKLFAQSSSCYRNSSGANLEFASQILENFSWNPTIFKLMEDIEKDTLLLCTCYFRLCLSLTRSMLVGRHGGGFVVVADKGTGVGLFLSSW